MLGNYFLKTAFIYYDDGLIAAADLHWVYSMIRLST
jgi:hypothetical protein